MSTGSPSTRISTVWLSGARVQTICAQISDSTGAGSTGQAGQVDDGRLVA